MLQIVESGAVEWPWRATRALLIISGAAGGGGGGGGAFCMQGLNLHGGGGGRGGGGGGPTRVEVRGNPYCTSGGGGGAGGGGGGVMNGKPIRGKDGGGCHFGEIAGGRGARIGTEVQDSDAITADGGDGGRGFPGETIVEEITDLSVGDSFEITIGQGGRGGIGGKGFLDGQDGCDGHNGRVLLVPIHEEARVR